MSQLKLRGYAIINKSINESAEAGADNCSNNSIQNLFNYQYLPSGKFNNFT